MPCYKDEETERLIHDSAHITKPTTNSLRPHIFHILIELLLLTYVSLQHHHISRSSHTLRTIAEYRVQRFRGSSYFPSPYKGPPTDAVEDAWAALWDIGAIQISEEEFSHVNASPHAVEVPPELGGGRMAMLEVNHQIHCLHMLWQHSYPDYYQEAYNYSIEKPEHWHEHMDHCADMLRQQLMCSADNTVVTYNWLKGHYAPQPNFNAVHRCGNFDAVLAWGKTRVIDGTALSGKDYWTRPERYVEFERIPYEPNEAGDQFPVD